MQERAKKTMKDILLSARKEFSDKGFHGARVDVIAASAGVNKQRIYAYYTNKEGLFQAVLMNAFEAIVKEEKALLDLPETDIPRLTERLIEHYLSFHAKQPHFWRLLSWENLDGGRHVESLRGIKEPVFQHLRELYQKGQTAGHFRKEVSFETYIFTVSAISFFYYSNLKTMSQTLQMDLANPKNRKRIISEVMQFLAK